MSGKTARKLRKRHILSKKTLAVCAGLCLSSVPVAAGGEFLISVFPHFTKPFGESHSMEYGIGGGLRATYRPIKFLNLFLEGDYLSMAMPGISPVQIIQGEVGTGYHLDVGDRFAFDLNMNVGVYNARSSKKTTGISAGGALTFSYKITPSIYVDVSATANHFAGKSSPLMMLNAGLAPGITFNITEFFNNRTNLGMEVNGLAPVFPVLYSWYEGNSFGNVNITNNEDSAITDVTISFYQPQYMAHAKECKTIRKIEQGETVSVDLVAFFNEQMLELTEKTDTSSYIIVNYMRLGKKLSQSFPLDVPVYGRNNMSWDDDRRAAVFVSSKDPAAMQFGKYTASIVRDNLRVDVPLNIQYALGIFEALNQYGINYVVDPSSAFEDNVGTSSIDFLQFPYQTLMYRGGDCDDLSILVCSLFEAVGIDTAFITVPGHIFMAFNAGISPDMAKTVFKNTSDFIFIDDEVWVPLEITLSDEGFYKACRYGAREWNSAYAQGTAALYKMSDSWKTYQPISVPGASAYMNMPEADAIALAFANGIDQWSHGELKTLTVDRTVQFVMLKEKDEAADAEVVIEETPLSTNNLRDVIALASNATVLPPAAIREEELEDDEEQEDELLEDILPLEYALATLQTDTTVVQETPVVELDTDLPETSETPVVESDSEEETIELVSFSDEAVSSSDEAVSSSDEAVSSSGLTRGSSPDSEVQIPVSRTGMTEKSSTEMTEQTTADETPFESVESLAAAFIAESPEIEAPAHEEETEAETTPVVELPQSGSIETQNDGESVKNQAERVGLGLTTETDSSSDNPVVSIRPSDYSTTGDDDATRGTTRNILIISSVTIAAALAAGIIIFGKKKRREGEK